MLDKLEQIYAQSERELDQAASTEALEAWYRQVLGRRGAVTQLTRQVGQLEPEERPAFGKRVNVIKTELEAADLARDLPHLGRHGLPGLPQP